MNVCVTICQSLASAPELITSISPKRFPIGYIEQVWGQAFDPSWANRGILGLGQVDCSMEGSPTPAEKSDSLSGIVSTEWGMVETSFPLMDHYKA